MQHYSAYYWMNEEIGRVSVSELTHGTQSNRQFRRVWRNVKDISLHVLYADVFIRQTQPTGSSGFF